MAVARVLPEYINKPRRANGIKTFYWDNGVQPSGECSRCSTAPMARSSTGVRSTRSSAASTAAWWWPGIIANGTYRMISRHSGKALDVSGHNTTDGANVSSGPMAAAITNAGRSLTSEQHLPDHRRGERKGPRGGEHLDANGTNVDIRTYTGASNQRWTISATSGGFYRLSPASSTGSALDVSGSLTADGANVHQWAWPMATTSNGPSRPPDRPANAGF